MESNIRHTLSCDGCAEAIDQGTLPLMLGVASNQDVKVVLCPKCERYLELLLAPLEKFVGQMITGREDGGQTAVALLMAVGGR